MIYSIGAIRAMVRKSLDENEVSTALIEQNADTDTLSLNAIIEQKIEQAARLVQEMAPRKLLDEGAEFPDTTISWDGEPGHGSGYVSLPEDYQRLCAFRMSDWHRPVNDAIAEGDAAYAIQSSRYKGVRGGPWKPVCAVATRNSGRVLEFYSCDGGADVFVSVARYYPYPSIANGKIRICAGLLPPTVEYAAGLASIAIGEETHGTALISNAAKYLKAE
jgi:hypothetical protein